MNNNKANLMYYPYLFARRAELLAFRDTVEQLEVDDTVVPVFEPVSSNIDSLRLALRAADTAQHALYLVMNPILGKFESVNPDTKHWHDIAIELVEEISAVRPAFLAGPKSTVADLKEFLKQWRGRDVGVVFRNTVLTPGTVGVQVAGRVASCRFFLTGGTPSPSTFLALGKKNCVFIEDRFQVQPSNAKYKGIEPFTGSHLTYEASGYGGFGDYACLPGKYRKGGSLPAAVAIHLTFLRKSDHEVFVEHFVSKSQRQDDRDIPKKMREAIADVVAARRRTADSFGLTVAYRKYMKAHDTREDVGLQVNKRWSVAHHLDLMSGLLSGRFS